MKHFRRIKTAIDPKPFLEEIAAAGGAWTDLKGRQDKTNVQRRALAIPLRVKRKPAAKGGKARGAQESRWTGGSKTYPLACRFLRDFAAEQNSLLGGAKIVCLPAGGRIYPDINHGEYSQPHNRYHFVLRSTQGFWLKADDEEVRMREGEVWWFDNKQIHDAANDGGQDRIHMIFDLLPKAGAGEILDETRSKESEPMSTAAAPAQPLQASSDFTLSFRPAKGNDALSCWLALPKEVSPDAPPLVAVHGIQRGAKAQAELYGARAAASGRPVIAPLFDEKNWRRYQQVVRKERSDLALLSLLTELQLEGVWRTRTIELAGYSGGAQFAHRFAMLYPHLVSRLTVASAGWYTFPDSTAFPYGLAARPGRKDDWGPRIAAGLDRFLRLPITACVGALDNIPDENTRSGEKIDRQQGSSRLERAKRWTETLRQAALARGIAPSISLAILPGCGHDFRSCVLRGGLDWRALPDSGSSGQQAENIDLESSIRSLAS